MASADLKLSMPSSGGEGESVRRRRTGSSSPDAQNAKRVETVALLSEHDDDEGDGGCCAILLVLLSWIGILIFLPFLICSMVTQVMVRIAYIPN